MVRREGCNVPDVHAGCDDNELEIYVQGNQTVNKIHFLLRKVESKIWPTSEII